MVYGMMYNIGNQQEEITYKNPKKVQPRLYTECQQVGHKREKPKENAVHNKSCIDTNYLRDPNTTPIQCKHWKYE